LGRSAGSAKGKPKIEAYDKDRKKGAGALITPAKVPFYFLDLCTLLFTAFWLPPSVFQKWGEKMVR